MFLASVHPDIFYYYIFNPSKKNMVEIIYNVYLEWG